jgi:hypothetical protein
MPHCTHYIGERFIWKNLPEELFRRFKLGLSISVVLQANGRISLAHDSVLLDGLVGFIDGGLKAGESYRHCHCGTP